MKTKEQIIKGAIEAFGEYQEIVKLSSILNQVLLIQEQEFLQKSSNYSAGFKEGKEDAQKEFLEMIKRFNKKMNDNLDTLKEDLNNNSLTIKQCYEDYKEVTQGDLEELKSAVEKPFSVEKRLRKNEMEVKNEMQTL